MATSLRHRLHSVHTLYVSYLNMIIDCSNCKARVDAEVVGMVEQTSFPGDQRIYLLRCPACSRAIVGVSDQLWKDDDDSFEWAQLVRVHPNPARQLSSYVPALVRESVIEAERCMQIGAVVAAVAMIGRALEAVCRHFSTDPVMLGQGIRELKEKGLIDQRLYEWSEQLHLHRNIAAHATEQSITARDAADLLSFTYAILDYLFELTARFDAFQRRKEREKEND